MARFAIVAPPTILEGLDKAHLLGGSHLLLAHDIVKHPKRYEAIFSTKRNASGMLLEYTDRFVILDNSVIELGTAVDIQMIADAAHIVKPTCIVLPDVMLKAVDTITSCSEALLSWGKHLPREFQKYMIAPQGVSLKEFTACAEFFGDEPLIRYWGIPRNLVACHGSRQNAIRACKLIDSHRPIHMLGFSDNMLDDVICARNESVYSIDSAVPLRYPSRLLLSSNIPPRGDWWETAKMSERVITNLQTARGWFNGRAL